jgi:hypothetical protein
MIPLRTPCNTLARLRRRSTDDGLVEMRDEIPIGKLFVLDMNSRQMVLGFNVPQQRAHKKEWVYGYGHKDGPEAGGWLCLELLEVLGQ